MQRKSPNKHVLMIKVSRPGGETKSHAFNIEVLNYLVKIKPFLRQMGIAVDVMKVEESSLSNQRLKQAMLSKGIRSLPALKTQKGVYLGVQSIKELYNRNVDDFKRSRKQDTGGDSDLDAYFRRTLDAKAEDDDDDETAIGESGEMMTQYQSLMQRRDEAQARRRPGSRLPEPDVRQTRIPQRGQAPQRGPAPQDRGHNVGSDPDDIKMEALMEESDPMPGPGVSASTLSASRGADPDDEPGESTSEEDRRMEEAYWSNQEASL